MSNGPLWYTCRMKTIVITGGSGFIGTLIATKLLANNYRVVILDTQPPRITNDNLEFKKIDPSNIAIDPAWVDGAHGIINLAGVPIFGRFTQTYKSLVWKSRIDTTAELVRAMGQTSLKPQVLVSASAIGYYGNTNGTTVSESAAAGTDFLARVCVEWEQQAMEASKLGVRTVILRTAHVIGKGGILGVLVPLFKKWIGGYFGSGTQHMPWIGANDLVDMYIYALENEALTGAYNTAVGNPTQREFMKTIARAVHAPITWAIPGFVARLLYLEFADALLVDTAVDNTKIKTAGFNYNETDLYATIVTSTNT